MSLPNPTPTLTPTPIHVPEPLPSHGYPLSSSGRGFISSTPNPNPNLAVPSTTTTTRSNISTGYPPRPPLLNGFPLSAYPHHFKAGSSLSLPDSIAAHRPPTDRLRDDVCVFTVRDRKVRISDGASLYALCRSWLRNGHPEETQFGDTVKSLPRPAPASTSYSSLKINDADKEEENCLDEKAVESISSQELLQLHIKRAKRVRERLREERLRRIARYKSRLALLLPPLVEQCRNDPTDGG